MGKNRSKISYLGFTLIEVLVALAILVIVLGVLLKGLTQGARNAAYLEDRTIAHWVAANVVAEYQLGENSSSFGEEEEGETKMAGRSWYWTTRIETTDDPDLRRIEVEVRPEGRSAPVLDTLVSYVARPFQEAHAFPGEPGGG